MSEEVGNKAKEALEERERKPLKQRVQELETVVESNQVLLGAMGLRVLDMMAVMAQGEVIINELCDLMERITDVPMKCRMNKELEEIVSRITRNPLGRV
jgi:hypothetical protein